MCDTNYHVRTEYKGWNIGLNQLYIRFEGLDRVKGHQATQLEGLGGKSRLRAESPVENPERNEKDLASTYKKLRPSPRLVS
jgi:hypothetical protein